MSQDSKTPIQWLSEQTPNLITKVITKQIKRKKSGKKQAIYQISYVDGNVVNATCINETTAKLQGLELLHQTFYCGCLKTTTAHAYFKIDNTVKCLTCGSDLDKNDDRPLAKVLSFNEQK